MKKKSVTGKRGGKRSAKDLTARRAKDPRGGRSIQKKDSDTQNAVISKIG